MSKFILIVGLPRSGADAVARLLAESGFAVGHKTGSIGDANPGLFSPYWLSDERLRSTYAAAISTAPCFMKSLSRELDESEIRELRAVAYGVLEEGDWAIKNTSVLTVLPYLWSVVRQCAYMVVCNRDPVVIQDSLGNRAGDGFTREVEEYQSLVAEARLLFQQAGRPVLDLQHDDFENDGVSESQLGEYLGVTAWGGECQSLNWLDVFQESFER